MNDLDMSRPGSELFPEAAVTQQYNSYQDVNVGHANGDDTNYNGDDDESYVVGDGGHNDDAYADDAGNGDAT